MNNNNKKIVLDILKKNRNATNDESLYSKDKQFIINLFENTDSSKETDILLRLTAIDNLYATQMSYRYYGLYELATALYTLSQGKNLQQLFLNFVEDEKIEVFNINNENDNLWNKSYGIYSSGNIKRKAISLISKYAYFETKCAFPIYDNLVHEIYPLLWNFCGFDNKVISRSKMVNSIVDHIRAMKMLKEQLSNPEISLDGIDRILWSLGKINKKSYAALMTKEEFVNFRENQDNLQPDLFVKNPFILAVFELSKKMGLPKEKNNKK